jgi:hypothetical protein
LNREEIAGLKARERPGWGVTEKTMHWNLTNKNAEEIHDLRERQRIAIEEYARRQADFDALRDRISDLARAVGEQPSE